jgi:hypothetical protein
MNTFDIKPSDDIQLDGKDFYMGFFSDVCSSCKHQYDVIEKGRTCKAFPEGIPDEIWLGENKHLKPLPDQKNDIVFEKK